MRTPIVTIFPQPVDSPSQPRLHFSWRTQMPSTLRVPMPAAEPALAGGSTTATAPRAGQSTRRWLLALLAGAALLVGGVVPVRASQTLPDFTELVEKVGPAVVNIRTLERGRAAASGAGRVDPNMEEFFRRFGIPMPGRPAPRPGPNGDEEPQQRGVGSGFILSSDGFVMTNAHVIDGADEVLVTLTDKREFKARIIGSDRRTDVAVVKIDATGLPSVRIGDVSEHLDLTWMIHAHLGDATLLAFTQRKQRQRHANVVVQIAKGGAGGDLLLHHDRCEIFCRCLSVAAGQSDDQRIVMLAVAVRHLL